MATIDVTHDTAFARAEKTKLIKSLRRFDVSFFTAGRNHEAELVSPPETLQPPRRRSQNCDIAGAGFGQTSTTAYRLVELRRVG